MNFFTMSNLPPKSKHPTFSKTKPIFAYETDEIGSKVLHQVGETNIQEEIQMYASECNIYNIIRRYQMGDTGILHKVDSQYIDTLGQPKTLQEALNLSLKLKNDFSSLKPDVRSAFNNDFNQFLKAVADGSAIEIFKGFQDVNQDVKQDLKEVSIDE